mmetsp:Transcript_51558/g.147215  ORF Transcript_51558/g.147215 Transcript_51558/m.147215 type:complete len:283 (+) Transcript_51558:714-1562(+)
MCDSVLATQIRSVRVVIQRHGLQGTQARTHRLQQVGQPPPVLGERVWVVLLHRRPPQAAEHRQHCLRLGVPRARPAVHHGLPAHHLVPGAIEGLPLAEARDLLVRHVNLRFSEGRHVVLRVEGPVWEQLHAAPPHKKTAEVDRHSSSPGSLCDPEQPLLVLLFFWSCCSVGSLHKGLAPIVIARLGLVVARLRGNLNPLHVVVVYLMYCDAHGYHLGHTPHYLAGNRALVLAQPPRNPAAPGLEYVEELELADSQAVLLRLFLFCLPHRSEPPVVHVDVHLG